MLAIGGSVVEWSLLEIYQVKLPGRQRVGKGGRVVEKNGYISCCP